MTGPRLTHTRHRINSKAVQPLEVISQEQKTRTSATLEHDAFLHLVHLPVPDPGASCPHKYPRAQVESSDLVKIRMDERGEVLRRAIITVVDEPVGGELPEIDDRKTGDVKWGAHMGRVCKAHKVNPSPNPKCWDQKWTGGCDGRRAIQSPATEHLSATPVRWHQHRWGKLTAIDCEPLTDV